EQAFHPGGTRHLPRDHPAPRAALRRRAQPGRRGLAARAADRQAQGQGRRLHDRRRAHRRGAAGGLSRPEDLRQHGRRLQQLRLAGDDGCAGARHQHPRRADRDHGRFRLRADDGDRAAHGGERALPARRQVDQVGLRHVRRLRRARQHAGHPGHGPHRPGHRPARRPRLRHAGDLPQPVAPRARSRGRLQGPLRVQGRIAADGRPPGAGAALLAPVAPHDRRRRAGADEADRHPGQHRARRHRGRRGSGQGPSGPPHRRRGTGRVRGRAQGAPGPAHGPERGPDAPHRQCHRTDPAGDGEPGGRQPDRLPRSWQALDASEPGSAAL
ncbi:MAG: Glyoxylate reductase / Glyoxylate reductase / Hydroxypyruvate reductase; 2-ketoaldonate reductase, broad specificity, partial [uncultured Ramlibacter sp.]